MLVVMPFFDTSSDALAPSSFFFLVVRPGATFVACLFRSSRDALLQEDLNIQL